MKDANKLLQEQWGECIGGLRVTLEKGKTIQIGDDIVIQLNPVRKSSPKRAAIIIKASKEVKITRNERVFKEKQIKKDQKDFNI